MASDSGLPVLTDADLGDVPFTTVACHNCKPSCSKESPVMYKGEKVVLCAERFMTQVLDQQKPQRKGPPIFVIIPFAAAVVFVIAALVLTKVL
ncbi:MAG: hypothetical protein Q4D06_02080 [Coriobacteriia bacterium]|nr:hypothetical protein [Coriobacteriia bacterium]